MFDSVKLHFIFNILSSLRFLLRIWKKMIMLKLQYIIHDNIYLYINSLGVSVLLLRLLYKNFFIHSLLNFTADSEKEISLSFCIENFTSNSPVVISSGSTSHTTSLMLSDSSGRPVHLQIKIKRTLGKALSVRCFIFFIFRKIVSYFFKC